MELTRARSKAAWVAIVLCASAMGCSEQSASKIWGWVGERLGLVAGGGSAPADPARAEAAAWAKASRGNAEFLQEVFRVVWLQEPTDKAEFGNWVDTLNQGASFEGVYNAFTHASHYRELEQRNRGASVAALRAFTEELAALSVELPQPTRFTTSAASPLPMPVEPSAEGGSAESDLGDSRPTRPPGDLSKLREEYAGVFVGASVFTLKRVLGDEALKVLTSKSQYREKLAEWYGKWVVRMCGRGVDFGLALRNKPDEALHYQWALQATMDRIVWETLNRLHRVINAAHEKKN